MGKPPKSESIVVQGAEVKKQQPSLQKTNPAISPAKQKKEDNIISGEDVVDKLDSFFGFDDK
jgi:hypothetical protein